jgi:hypothetical protein
MIHLFANKNCLSPLYNLPEADCFSFASLSEANEKRKMLSVFFAALR